MQQHQEGVAPPTRGIIVVDSGSLLPMCTQLSNEFLTKEAQGDAISLADTLYFLAKHGYEIIIPEIVAHKCGEFMRDGTSVQNYFSDPAYGSFPDPYYLHAQHFFHSLEKHQAEGANIRIEPPAANDRSKEADFIRNTWHTHKDVREDRAGHVDDVKRATFKALKQKATLNHASVEKMTGDILASLKNSTVPVFYLSDNKRRREHVIRARSDMPINELSFMGVYNALAKQNLLCTTGIENHPERMFHQNIHQGMVLKGLWDTDSEMDGITHQAIDKPSARSSNLGSFPFADSLKGLKQEIEQKAPKNIIDASDAALKPKSRIDLWNEKYKNRQTGKSGNTSTSL